MGNSLEFNIGIIAACAPSLKPLLSRALHLSTSARKSSTPYIDRAANERDSSNAKRRGYVMQASQDDGADFELGHITCTPHEHSTTVRGGQSAESKESVATGSFDFVVGARHDVESQMAGIRVTRVTKVSVQEGVAVDRVQG